MYREHWWEPKHQCKCRVAVTSKGQNDREVCVWGCCSRRWYLPSQEGEMRSILCTVAASAQGMSLRKQSHEQMFRGPHSGPAEWVSWYRAEHPSTLPKPDYSLHIIYSTCLEVWWRILPLQIQSFGKAGFLLVRTGLEKVPVEGSTKAVSGNNLQYWPFGDL